VDQQGKERPMYYITKDGFIFLAMGFTGEKAAQIEEAYITAFNRMEAQLTKQTLRNSDVAAFISNLYKWKSRKCL
ncbi:MAG: Rha family transcriptional regulator, partial [Thiotrichaceae bacterium]